MADIRINALSTTATISAADDFLVLDGTTNGTRKINASAPAFLTSITVPLVIAPAALALNASGNVTINTTNGATLAATFSGANTTLAGNLAVSGTTSATDSTTGALLVGNGSASTNVAIGGGNIWAGGYLDANGITIGNNFVQGSVATLATHGVALRSKTGSTYDFSLLDPTNNFNILVVPTGTINVTLAGNLAVSGTGIESTDTLTGAGAVSVTKTTTKITTNGVGNALTLADGVDGQIKRVVLDVLGAGGQTAILTPTTKSGYTTITLTAAGQTASLQFTTTSGWVVIGSFGSTIV